MIASVRDLSKKYGSTTVFTDLSLDLQEGVIHGLIGRNGTGKSTLLSILAGQIRATGGEVRVFGHDPFDDSRVMGDVVYAGIDVPYPRSWKVRDILSIAAQRYAGWDASVVDDLVGSFELDTRKRYSTLSRGQCSMVGIIVGLASHAPVTLLDEPYLGLDVQNRDIFYRYLMEEQQRHPRTIVLATHHLAESARLIDHYLLLGRDGTLLGDYPTEDIDDAFVSVEGTGMSEQLRAQALHIDDLAGRTRVIVNRRHLPSDPSALTGLQISNVGIDEAVALLTGEGK